MTSFIAKSTDASKRFGWLLAANLFYVRNVSLQKGEVMATKSSSRKSRSSSTSRKKSTAGGSKKKTGGRKYSKKAGAEVRTEMHHMRSGKHKVKNRKQAVAIGLSKARQKGAKVPKKKAA